MTLKFSLKFSITWESVEPELNVLDSKKFERIFHALTENLTSFRNVSVLGRIRISSVLG